MVGGDEPLGEIESVGRFFGFERRKNGGRVGFHFFTALLVGTNREDVGFSFLGLVFHDHDLGKSVAEVVELLRCRFFLLFQFGKLGIAAGVRFCNEIELGGGAVFEGSPQSVDEALVFGKSEFGFGGAIDAEISQVVVFVW